MTKFVIKNTLQNRIFILANEFDSLKVGHPLKVIKNAFHFVLKALSVLKIFKFLSLLLC